MILVSYINPNFLLTINAKNKPVGLNGVAFSRNNTLLENWATVTPTIIEEHTVPSPPNPTQSLHHEVECQLKPQGCTVGTPERAPPEPQDNTTNGIIDERHKHL